MSRSEGDIFVTELGPSSSIGKLNQIGVFGNKQDFVIQFNEEIAFLNDARVRGTNPERSIYTIPGNSILIGIFKVIKR